MELMKVTLHSDVIERFEKIYQKLNEVEERPSLHLKQVYLDLFTAIQDLDIIHLRINTDTMEYYYIYPDYNPYPNDRYKNSMEQYVHKYARFNKYHILIPEAEELIDKIIYDSRIGIGFCIQCGYEYPIEQGCIQESHRLGRCHPKNFIPCLDKDRKKVFKGLDFHKHHSVFNSDEFLPHSPEVMEERRRQTKVMGEACRLGIYENLKEIDERVKKTGVISESDLSFVRVLNLLDKSRPDTKD